MLLRMYCWSLDETVLWLWSAWHFTYGKYEWTCFSILGPFSHWMVELGMHHLLLVYKRPSLARLMQIQIAQGCLRSFYQNLFIPNLFRPVIISQHSTRSLFSTVRSGTVPFTLQAGEGGSTWRLNRSVFFNICCFSCILVRVLLVVCQ